MGKRRSKKREREREKQVGSGEYRLQKLVEQQQGRRRTDEHGMEDMDTGTDDKGEGTKGGEEQERRGTSGEESKNGDKDRTRKARKRRASEAREGTK